LIYSLGKAVWLLDQPGNLLVLAIAFGALLLFTRWRGLGRFLVVLAALLALAIALLPVGDWLLRPLEERFPPLSDLPPKVDGIIMLGGAVNTEITESRHQPTVNDHAERFIAFVDLARRYPTAKLVFSGGGPELENGNFREADAARLVLQWMGMDTSRVIFERESRNTYENVIDSKALTHPMAGEAWLLITSAYHMPRAVGLFRAQGWTVIADPVDYQTAARKASPDFSMDFQENLNKTSLALKEWIGLTANRWLGRSQSLLPSP
jgi:uncharacterized SAM-binding protein YcdF (DUF218 family)